MKYFSALIKPASSKCNLQCRYCFYRDVANNRSISDYGVMSSQIMGLLIDNVLNSFLDEVEIQFAFQGGEPLCAGLIYFEEFVSYVNTRKKKYHHVNYSIQTNGTLIDNQWIEFFKVNKFLVGLSLDGFETNNDKYRGMGTYRKIMNAVELLRINNVEFNILTVLTNELAKHPNQLFDFYKDHGFNNVQLIPCIAQIGEHNSYQLAPNNFYTFYDAFFDNWFNHFIKGNYISISFFDDLIRMFKGLLPFQCGALGFCSIQFIVEADGSVYPCDFYVTDDYKMGNISENSIIDLTRSTKAKMFLSEKRRTSKLCAECKFINICHNQCKRLNVCIFDNDTCGFRSFLMKNENKISYISSMIR